MNASLRHQTSPICYGPTVITDGNSDMEVNAANCMVSMSAMAMAINRWTGCTRHAISRYSSSALGADRTPANREVVP